MDELRDYFNRLEPGPVEETTRLERLLAEVWDGSVLPDHRRPVLLLA